MLVGDLVNYSLRLSGILGVGQSPLAQDESDAITALKMMTDQWWRRRWIVYRLDPVSVPVTPLKTTYTIGTTPPVDVNHPRPGSIESAFLRQLAGWGFGNNTFPVDYPLIPIRSREEWNAIPLKNLGSWPARFFYDPTLPNGTLYIWPVPIQNFFELHFSTPQDIELSDPATEVTSVLPPESEEALVYNLACRLRVNYRLPADPAMVALAQTSLNTLRATNYAVRTLRMPASLRRDPRMKNPMGGFYSETNAGIPFPVLS